MLKLIARRAFNAIGLDIHRVPTSPFAIQKELLPDCKTIFDVGANVGSTVVKYRALFPDAVIHAFEPTPRFVAALQARAEHDQRLKVHPFALSDRPGTATLSLNSFGDTNSLLRTEPTAPLVWRQLMQTRDTLDVDTRTLDDVCRDAMISEIDILKIDVQGAEAMVLRGASNMLSSQRIKMVLLEVVVAPTYSGQSRPAEIFGLLNDAGLAIVNFYDLVPDKRRLLQFDALFALPEIIQQN
jgi:FkbM family methyltransferase